MMDLKGDNNNGYEAESRQTKGLDELDVEILDYMIIGAKTKQIAAELGRPLSTVQRRIRQLFASGAVRPGVELNYTKLGLKRGELFVYVRNGNVREIANKLAGMQGILAVSVHIGNSDVIVTFMYKDSSHLLEFTSAIRDIPEVERVVWSEEIYSLPLKETRKLGSVMRYNAAPLVG